MRCIGLALLIALLAAAPAAAQDDTTIAYLGAAGRDTSFGFGRVNLQKAVAP
jgi:hypothetical protein